jgi:hypothetical protein
MARTELFSTATSIHNNAACANGHFRLRCGIELAGGRDTRCFFMGDAACFGAKAELAFRTPRRFAHTKATESPTGLGVRARQRRFSPHVHPENVGKNFTCMARLVATIVNRMVNFVSTQLQRRAFAGRAPQFSSNE